MIENKRIEYIDSMRGFTMILVVAFHVAYFCLGMEDYTPSIHPFLFEFRMPLFFFISGFVLYKKNIVWDMQYVCSFLIKKKFPVQIVTTLIFFLIYLKISGTSITDGIHNQTKLGYWFTYVLFVYFCVYSILMLAFHYIKVNDIFAELIILAIGFCFYALFWVESVNSKLPIDNDIKSLLSLRYWGYFLFFTIGTLFKKHFTQIQMILDKKVFLTICLVVYFGFNLYYDELKNSHFYFLNLLTAITGIVIVFSFFRIHQAWFNKEKFVGKCLQYVGRRTLDVYLLHFLLLPTNLKVYFTFLTTHPVPIIEFTITLTIALIVVIGCLTISRILRMSPTLAYLLFGVKNRKN